MVAVHTSEEEDCGKGWICVLDSLSVCPSMCRVALCCVVLCGVCSLAFDSRIFACLAYASLALALFISCSLQQGKGNSFCFFLFISCSLQQGKGNSFCFFLFISCSLQQGKGNSFFSPTYIMFTSTRQGEQCSSPFFKGRLLEELLPCCALLFSPWQMLRKRPT
jgi:hypothetical protein